MLTLLKDILEPELMDEINAAGKTLHLAEGQVLLDIGQIVTSVPIVVKGTLRISRTSEDGHDLLLYYVSADQSCAMTFTCCMQQFPSQVKITAEEEADVLLIPMKYMDTWMQRFPSWKSFVMNTIRSRFNELLNAIDQIAFMKLDERLLSYLKEKTAISGDSVIHMSHEQIAIELGSSREVISRLLKKLENDKYLTLGRNMIRLIKPV